MSESPVFRSVRRPERRGRGLAARLAKWLIVLLLVAAVAIVGLLVHKAAGAMDPVSLQTLVLNETDPDALVDEVEGTQVTLVVGVDRRAVPPAAIADATADPRGPAAAQMISLVQTMPTRDGTAVVTFPLDLMVLPTGQPDHVRLDRVQALAGPDALLATIQRLTGIRVDHYVEVDLAGVVDMVDAVGGVEVCLDEVMQAPAPTGSPSASEGGSATATPARSSGTASPAPTTGTTSTPRTGATSTSSATPGVTPSAGDGPADATSTASPSPRDGVSQGCQVLDGAAAAGFLSSRSDPSRPVGVQRRRIAEQHYLLSRVLDRTRLSTVLFNPLRVNRVLDALDTAVVSDVDPGLRGMLDMADGITTLDRNGLIVRVVPSYRRSEDGDTLLYPDQAAALFQALRSGESLAEVGRVTGDEVGPEDVNVLVVNGVGTPGLAGDAATYLQSRGFQVACAVNPSDMDPRATFDDSQVDIVLQHRERAQVATELVVTALGDLPVMVREVEQLPPMPANPECRFNEDGTVDVVMTVGTGYPQ